MLLEHPAQTMALAGLTVRAPAAAPRFSYHSGLYCEDCSHEGFEPGALLVDGCSERDAACKRCCSYDELELPGERVSRLGQRCGGVNCDRRLRDGAWLVGDRAEAFALCFRCAVADVLEHAPLTLCVEAVNIVGGEPALNDVLAVLGYRTAPGSKFFAKNILSTFGDVLVENVTAFGAWDWLRKQGVRTAGMVKPSASISAAITRGAAALQPAVVLALELRRRSVSIPDEVA